MRSRSGLADAELRDMELEELSRFFHASPDCFSFSPVYMSLQVFSSKDANFSQEECHCMDMLLSSPDIQAVRSRMSPSPSWTTFLLTCGQYLEILHARYFSHFHIGNSSAPQNLGSSSQSFGKDSSKLKSHSVFDFLDSDSLFWNQAERAFLLVFPSICFCEHWVTTKKIEQPGK